MAATEEDVCCYGYRGSDGRSHGAGGTQFISTTEYKTQGKRCCGPARTFNSSFYDTLGNRAAPSACAALNSDAGGLCLGRGRL